MDRFQIQGGLPLQGQVRISGAKNAALPILCASLLTAEPLVVHNVPPLRDVGTMRKLLAGMGLQIEVDAQAIDGQDSLTLRAHAVNKLEAPYELVKTMSL